MDNTTSLFIGAALGLIVGLEISSYLRRQRNNEFHNLIINKLKNMAVTLDQVLESVTNNATVGDSAIALLRGIKQQLDAVLAGGISPALQAKVDAIFAASEADKAKLEAAIVENTPAEEPPVEPTP